MAPSIIIGVQVGGMRVLVAATAWGHEMAATSRTHTTSGGVVGAATTTCRQLLRVAGRVIVTGITTEEEEEEGGWQGKAAAGPV
jgi:hypothetical protein